MAKPGEFDLKETTWCERGDSNPHIKGHQILSLARLPIPPLSHNTISISIHMISNNAHPPYPPGLTG